MYQVGEPVESVRKIRDAIDYPIIDADAHVIEARFALHDFVKQVAGPDVLKAFESRQERRNKTAQRNGFWASPSGEMTIDRATVMLPGLYYERLQEAGIDFALIYTSEGLSAQQIREPEMRQALHRALNMLYADMFGPYADRMTASAVIPMHSPEEALAELEFVVGELGMKTSRLIVRWITTRSGGGVWNLVWLLPVMADPKARRGVCPRTTLFITDLVALASVTNIFAGRCSWVA